MVNSTDNAAPSVTADLVLDTMAEGVVALDMRGRICMWNAAMAAITGYSREEALGQPHTWLRFPTCSSRAVEEFLADSRRLRQAGCVRGVDCIIRGRRGERIPVLANVRVLTDVSGETVGLLQTVTDNRSVEELTRQLGELRAGRGDPPNAFHGLIGRSSAMQEAYRLIGLASASDVNVLLLGESGTGKELAAQAIHQLSRRAARPFVRVNCGALTETILESELFGHVKGAFTGAYQDRVGRFEAADGGTILLDEIGEVGPALQVKLLRVLQEGEFERVGESRTRTVDVRVIAATNRDLAAEKRDGRFRDDLYYRLRVFPITLPALKDRLDDIPLLVEHFVKRFAAKTGKGITGLDESAWRAVMDYCWPGNVREVENAIEYGFVTCQSERIGLFDLPQELRRFELRRTTCPERGPREAPHADVSATAVVRSPEELKGLLDDCGWNKAEVARRLGISRTAVWKWMRKHGIPLRRE